MKAIKTTIFSAWLNALNALKENLSMLNIIFVLSGFVQVDKGGWPAFLPATR
jgi:hypothetical protein